MNLNLSQQVADSEFIPFKLCHYNSDIYQDYKIQTYTKLPWFPESL